MKMKMFFTSDINGELFDKRKSSTKTITGPFATLGAAATAKRIQAHAVAELRMMAKELKELADRAFSQNYPQLGAAIGEVSERARQLAALTENA